MNVPAGQTQLKTSGFLSAQLSLLSQLTAGLFSETFRIHASLGRLAQKDENSVVCVWLDRVGCQGEAERQRQRGRKDGDKVGGVGSTRSTNFLFRIYK